MKKTNKADARKSFSPKESFGQSLMQKAFKGELVS